MGLAIPRTTLQTCLWYRGSVLRAAGWVQKPRRPTDKALQTKRSSMAAAMLRTDAEKDDENFAKAMVYGPPACSTLLLITKRYRDTTNLAPAPLLLRRALAQRPRRLPVPVPAMPAERPARQQIWTGDGLP